MVVAIDAEAIVRAGDNPTPRWPGYSDISPAGQPTDVLWGPISHTGNLRSLSP